MLAERAPPEMHGGFCFPRCRACGFPRRLIFASRSGRSKLLYARKHYGIAGHLFAKTVLVVTSLGKWAALGVLALFRGDAETRTRARLARDASLYHFAGREPRG